MMVLAAKAVGIEDSKEVGLVLGFAEHADGSGPALFFQRSHRFDAQDIELGQNTYCLVTDAHTTTYGGIESWKLTAGQLDITLSHHAAHELGVDEDLVIEFAPAHIRMVKAALARILRPARTPPKPRGKKKKRPTAKPTRKAAKHR